MAKTYGFPGSDPTTGVIPTDSDGGAASVKTNTSQAQDYLLSDQFTGKVGSESVAGQSGVNGLGVTPTFDDAITGKEIEYTGNNASIGSGTANTLGGSWPLDGSVLDAPDDHKLADRPSDARVC